MPHPWCMLCVFPSHVLSSALRRFPRLASQTRCHIAGTSPPRTTVTRLQFHMCAGGIGAAYAGRDRSCGVAFLPSTNGFAGSFYGIAISMHACTALLLRKCYYCYILYHSLRTSCIVYFDDITPIVILLIAVYGVDTWIHRMYVLLLHADDATLNY